MHQGRSTHARLKGPRMGRTEGQVGSFGHGPWEPETLDLLRRFSESPQAFANGAAILDRLEGPNEAPKMENVLGRTLVHLTSQYLASRGIPGKLTFDANLPGLEAPEGPLKSLLEHLVDGSLRGSPAADPYCHVGVGAQDETSVTLFLRDNGVAIPECGLDQIRAFIQETRVEKVPDRIYRLFLADNLVRWVGGTMWVGPTANGGGTTVFIKLPKKTNAKGPENPLLARHVF